MPKRTPGYGVWASGYAATAGLMGWAELHPEPGREKELCCIGGSRSEAQPSGAWKQAKELKKP